MIIKKIDDFFEIGRFLKMNENSMQFYSTIVLIIQSCIWLDNLEKAWNIIKMFWEDISKTTGLNDKDKIEVMSSYV